MIEVTGGESGNEVYVHLEKWDPAFGKEVRLRLVHNLRCSGQDDLPFPYKVMLDWVVENQKFILDQLMEYILSGYPEFREGQLGFISNNKHLTLDEWKEELKNIEKFLPETVDRQKLCDILTPTNIFISDASVSGVRLVCFGFDCPWYNKQGLGLYTFCGEVVGRVTDFGSTRVDYTEWIARRIAGKIIESNTEENPE